MNKEQIIKRMNPEQLAKLNGPKTEIADGPTKDPLFNAILDDMADLIKEKHNEEFNNFVMTGDSSFTWVPDERITTLPEDYSWGNVNDLTEYEVHIDEEGKTTDVKRIDGPLNNVVGKMTGPNEYTYEGPIEEIVEFKTRMNEEVYDTGYTYDTVDTEPEIFTAGFVQVAGDATPIPEVTYTTTWPVSLEEVKPLKLGPGLREQLKDEAFTTQFNSPLDAPTSDGPAVSLPRTKKKKHRR